MESGQNLLIEDDSSVESSGTGAFPAPPMGRKATPITRPRRKEQESCVGSLRQDFSFREADEGSLHDIGVEDDNNDSLRLITKPEFVKKQPHRLYSKSKETTPANTSLRAHSTVSESMRKSSLRKPSSDRAGSLMTPRGQSLIGRKFVQPPKTKLLKPLPLLQPRGNNNTENLRKARSRSLRLRRYHRMLEDALRAKAAGKSSARPPTPKHVNRSAMEQSVKDHSFDDRVTLRKEFQTSFPVSERKIPEYDAAKDKHVKLSTFQARCSLRSQIQQRDAASDVAPKRNTVRFQDEITQIDQLPTDYKDKRDLYLPKILPQPSDRPNSAPHSQEVFGQKSALRRDQHSVPKSRGDAEPQERDWAKSVLDNCVRTQIYEFNAEADPSLFSEEELGEALIQINHKSWTHGELRELIGKGQTTLAKLHSELLLPPHVLQSPPVSKDGLQAVLLQCHTQLQLRNVVVTTLCDIHQREDLLLSLMTLGEDAGSDFSSMYREVMSLSKSILARIAQLKNLTQDGEKFLYMDSDYAEKIHEDSSNLMHAFRHLICGQRDYLNSTITADDLKGRAEGL